MIHSHTHLVYHTLKTLPCNSSTTLFCTFCHPRALAENLAVRMRARRIAYLLVIASVCLSGVPAGAGACVQLGGCAQRHTPRRAPNARACADEGLARAHAY
jgi:hypothetical protein